MSHKHEGAMPADPGIRVEVAELRDLLQEISWKMLRVQSARLADYGLTAPQAFVLHAINRFGPEIDMMSLAANTLLPASSITSIVDRLHEQGLVERIRSEVDRRRVTASITESGRELHTRIEEGSIRMLHDLLEDLDAGPIEQATAVFRHLNRKLEHPG